MLACFPAPKPDWSLTVFTYFRSVDNSSYGPDWLEMFPSSCAPWWFLLAWASLSGCSERTVLTVLEGGTVLLPCSITGGTVYTVLWYRDNQGQPFYTSVSVNIMKFNNFDIAKYLITGSLRVNDS